MAGPGSNANFLKEVANGIDNVVARLEGDVIQFCNLLNAIEKSIPNMGVDLSLPKNLKLKSKLQKNFLAIYMCLKLHLTFHDEVDTALNLKQLKEFGEKLSDETEANAVPSPCHAIDPGTKVLEILSDITAENFQKGSEQHADEVMMQARTTFRILGSKNIFQPKVLAKVSLNSFFFVGCSMSVSPFLRPLCLHNRIVKFKCRLKEAVVLDRPLSPGDQKDKWSSSAFMRKEIYTKPKDPCRNCQVMFQNLNGFIPTNAEEGNRDTFLGACAEYIPVNKLIKDDAQGTSADAVREKLQNNRSKGMYLFENYVEIVKECQEIVKECSNSYDMGTDDPVKMEQLQTAAYQKVYIFGFIPNVKM